LELDDFQMDQFNPNITTPTPNVSEGGMCLWEGHTGGWTGTSISIGVPFSHSAKI